MGKLSQTLAEYRDNPARFVEEILRVTPDEWQTEALKALSERNRVAIRSGHGVGKSAFESWAAIWFLFTRPFCKVICTAPTIRQLYDVLWSEISKWLKRSELLSSTFEWQKTKVICKCAPERWFAAARTAARPENMQGFHDDHLLFILDEASGIDDAIFEAIEGALTGSDNKLVMCGNPTRNIGFFKRAFFEDSELYSTLKVSSTESRRVSDEYCRRLIKQYGTDSDVVRVRVFGEFPKAETDGLIALEWVERSMMREPEYDGEMAIGVDVARFGDDETVVATRLGRSVLPLEAWRKTDLMTTVGRIIGTLERVMATYSKGRAVINVDDTGVGGGVTDRLREVLRGRRITINGCNNGSKAHDTHYQNWGAESYFALRDRFQSEEIILPRDEELAAQLSTRKYYLTSTDKLALETKGEYKKRIGRSPDRADALVLAFAPTLRMTMPDFPISQSYWLK